MREDHEVRPLNKTKVCVCMGGGRRLILLGSYIMRLSGVKANEWPLFIWAKPCGSPKDSLQAGLGFFFTLNKLAKSVQNVDNEVCAREVWALTFRCLDATKLFSTPLLFLSQLIQKALWKDEVGRNQNKWILLKPAMHQLLDKVINKQLRMVID